MPTAKLSFHLTPNCDAEQADEAVELLTAALRMNGQILGREHPTAWKGDTIHVHVLIPEEDALAKEHHNKYVTQRFADLRKAGVDKIRVKIFEEPSESEDLHARHESSSFILFTTYVMLASPLRCGDCFLPVPLYAIPPTYDNSEYYDVIGWESDYQACDTLQMNCRTGERFGTRQMSDPDSTLSRQGRDICDRITRSTGRPTFYFLYRYVKKTTLAQERAQRCPGCGGDWLLKQRWHEFDYRCDTCRLVSSISSTIT